MTALIGFGVFCCVLIIIFMFTGGIDDETIIYIYVLLGLAFSSFATSAICEAYAKGKTLLKSTDSPNKETGHEATKAKDNLASP